MPLDPARLEDTVRWLTRAGTDLRAARHDLAAVPPILDDAVFHCQQAAEKALKGFSAGMTSSFARPTTSKNLGNSASELMIRYDRSWTRPFR